MKALLRRVSGMRVSLPPPALLALLYAAAMLVGAACLKLPSAAIEPVSWSDAIFTSVSAVTVTGLVVVDLGSTFTLFGQVVITLLIQLGGLGLMTFAVLVLGLLGMRIGISQRVFLREDLNQTSIYGLLRLVRTILWVVLICETIGAALLAFRFVPDFGWGQGIWLSIFHSVSAFNNAGFALFPDGLMRYATDPVINVVIPVLFVLGGLGYSVVADVVANRRWARFTLHTKLMLVGTAGLIVVSVVGFALLEWRNPATLGGLASTGDRLMVSWFQGLTPRTAGFNTIDFAGVHDATALMVITLMLIGAAARRRRAGSR